MARFQQHRATLAIAAPTWHELLFGLLRLPAGRKRDIIEKYLLATLRPGVEILPYRDEEAAWHAGERARLTEIGRPPPSADAEIAAIAACRGLTLVTNNTADFQYFKGINLVNWMDE